MKKRGLVANTVKIAAKRRSRKKKREQELEEIEEKISIDLDNTKYVSAENWREVLKPINLTDDEYGSEYELDMVAYG